jgi:hypothetical protein
MQGEGTPPFFCPEIMASSRVKKLQSLTEDAVYVPGPTEYVITEDNSFEEILFHILYEIGGTAVERLEELQDLVESLSVSELQDYLEEREASDWSS